MKAQAYKWLEELASHDPEIRNVVILHELGIDINKIDRHAQLKREVDAKVTELAIKKIEEDPKLLNRFVRAKAFEIMNMKDPDLEPKPDPVDELIKQAEKVEEFKKAMGYRKPAPWESAVAKFMAVFIPLATMALNSAGKSADSQPPMVHVKVNGKDVEMPLPEYEEYSKKKSNAPQLEQATTADSNMKKEAKDASAESDSGQKGVVAPDLKATDQQNIKPGSQSESPENKNAEIVKGLKSVMEAAQRKSPSSGHNKVE
jgi:hypothetical protein